MANVDLTFIEWMIYGFPASILLILPAWGVLLLFFPPEMNALSRSKEELRQGNKGLGPMNREEKTTLVIFLFTVVLWLVSSPLERLLGISIPISMPVLLTATLFFFPKVSTIKWKDIEREISWSGIILVVTGVSLGMMLYQTGAAKWVSVALLGKIGTLAPILQVFIVIFIVSVLKVAFSSNTVTATIIIPIIIGLAQSFNIDVLSITLPAALTSSLAFILVTSTPTNVIPYSAGYFSIVDMAKAGIIMTIVSSIIVAGSIYAIGLLRGLY
jgi:sodium-dependent dicarboxylate transporter 2/3/5